MGIPFGALISASKNGHVGILKYLVSKGGDISERSYFGETLLHQLLDILALLNI
jgi:ankyrin repeat protein